MSKKQVATVGDLEDLLRPYPKSTDILVECDNCHTGAMGHNIIGLADNTNQTYGYITLKLLKREISTADVSLLPDKETFYKKEIEKLRAEIECRDKKLEVYRKECLEYSKSIRRLVDREARTND